MKSAHELKCSMCGSSDPKIRYFPNGIVADIAMGLQACSNEFHGEPMGLEGTVRMTFDFPNRIISTEAQASDVKTQE